MRGIILPRRRGIAAIAISAALTACGQTGALYLPETPPADAASASAGEDEDER